MLGNPQNKVARKPSLNHKSYKNYRQVYKVTLQVFYNSLDIITFSTSSFPFWALLASRQPECVFQGEEPEVTVTTLKSQKKNPFIKKETYSCTLIWKKGFWKMHLIYPMALEITLPHIMNHQRHTCFSLRSLKGDLQKITGHKYFIRKVWTLKKRKES